jgi:amino acid permease
MEQNPDNAKQKLGPWETLLTMVSLMVGPEIVCIPTCFMLCGTTLGITLLIISYFLSFIVSLFLLKTSDLFPYFCKSYFELGYALMGPISIYFTAVGIFITTTGFSVLYFVMASETISGLINQYLYG